MAEVERRRTNQEPLALRESSEFDFFTAAVCRASIEGDFWVFEKAHVDAAESLGAAFFSGRPSIEFYVVAADDVFALEVCPGCMAANDNDRGLRVDPARALLLRLVRSHGIGVEELRRLSCERPSAIPRRISNPLADIRTIDQ
jgi:hypothetical protein